MTELLEIAEKLQDTHAAVARLEQSIATKCDPPPSVLMMLRSLKRRQESLEAQFAEIAHTEYLDVCRYELFPQTAQRPTLTALGKTLLDFQYLFTQVYDALQRRVPRVRSRISQAVTNESAFTFAYTFSGSVGFVLTMPNERLLIGETLLDETIQKVFEMIKAGSSEEIAAHARQVGVGPVRTMYQWASDQLLSGVTSRIEWRRKEEVRSDLQIQNPELEALRKAIEAISDTVVNTSPMIGELRGWDVDSKTFHLKTATGDIRGKMSDEVAEKYSANQTVEVPRIYRATIRTETTISYAFEQETETHTLLSLEEDPSLGGFLA